MDENTTASATSTESFGTVTAVVGEVKVTATDGTVRLARLGDRVSVNEMVETTMGGAVHIRTSSGGTLHCGPGAAVSMGRNLIDLPSGARITLGNRIITPQEREAILDPTAALSPMPPEASTAAGQQDERGANPARTAIGSDPVNPSSDVAAIMAQIAAGADPSKVAQATAAGGAPGDGGGTSIPIVIGQANGSALVGDELQSTLNGIVYSPLDTSPAMNGFPQSPVLPSQQLIVLPPLQPLTVFIDDVVVTEPPLVQNVTSLVYTTTDGAGMQTTLIVKAGDVITFNWSFDSDDYLPFNDFAFVVINKQMISLSDTATVGDYGSTPWKTFTYVATSNGPLKIGFGVMNAGDTALDSWLMVDKLAVNGTVLKSFETGTLAGWDTIGNVSVVTSHDEGGTAPTDGGYMAALLSEAIPKSTMETFFGLSAGAIDGSSQSGIGNITTTSAVFTVSLSAPASEDVVISFSTANGTAISGGTGVGQQDYGSTSGNVTIAAGQTSANIVVTILGDSAAEPSEQFYVTLTGVVSGNATLADNTGTGAILNNDALIINGGSGNQTLTGGNGDDFLVGNAGNDTLNGGNGNDTYVYNSATDGVDSIVGFTIGNPATDANADILDLHDVLGGVSGLAAAVSADNTSAVGSYIQFVISGTGASTMATMKVDVDGAGAGAAQTLATFAVPAGTTADALLSTLLSNNQIVV